MGLRLPKMLKRAPAARKILERSIADILDGQWVCGKWAEACAIKPQGCAMGLVAINAAVPETVRFITRANGFVYADIIPMADGNWPKSARAAAAALASTVKAPVKTRRLAESNYHAAEVERFADSITEGIVIDYNDNGIKQPEALRWFKRALASLDA